MKLVTWNANMAFRKKQKYIVARYDPDIAVIQECESPDLFDHNLFPYSTWVRGPSRHKGIGIFSKAPIVIHSKAQKSHKLSALCKTGGFKLLTIWAQNRRDNSQAAYIGQVWGILRRHSSQVDKRTFILGDFNWSVIWDSPKGRRIKFADISSWMSARDFQSLYHFQEQEEFGEESKNTFFLYRHREKCYHTDYVFVHKTYSIKSRIDVGSFDDWSKLSDHMPLYVNVESATFA